MGVRRIQLAALRWVIQMRYSTTWQRLEKVLALEIISFVAIFGFAVALLEWHRFVGAIILFSLGCLFSAMRGLLFCFGLHSALARIPLIIVIFVVAIYGDRYLMDVVADNQGEYGNTVIEQATRNTARPQIKPNPSAAADQPVPVKPTHLANNKSFAIAETSISFDTANRVIHVSCFGINSAHTPLDVSVVGEAAVDGQKIEIEKNIMPAHEGLLPATMMNIEYAFTLNYLPSGAYEGIVHGTQTLTITLKAKYDHTTYRFVGESFPGQKHLVTRYSDWGSSPSSAVSVADQPATQAAPTPPRKKKTAIPKMQVVAPQVDMTLVAKGLAEPPGAPFADGDNSETVKEMTRLESMTVTQIRAYLADNIERLRWFDRTKWHYPAEQSFDEPAILSNGEEDPEGVKEFNKNMKTMQHLREDVRPTKRYEDFPKEFPKFPPLIQYLQGKFSDIPAPIECYPDSVRDKKLYEGVVSGCADYLQKILDNKFPRPQ